MVLHQHNTKSVKRPFRLVKFFAFTSFIVLIIFSFPFSVIVSRQAKDILMKSYENYALLLGENLNHQTFQNFVIPVVMQFGEISLRQKQQSEWLDRIVRNTVHSFNIDLVNIYDIDQGVIVYSTDSRLTGKKVRESLEYKKAAGGEQSSKLITGGSDLWGTGTELEKGAKKLRTYIPCRGMHPLTGKKGYLLGVFEIIQDLTQVYQSIVKLQYRILILSILIMSLIFLALLLIVNKAEGIIEERAREQKELENQLNQAERLAALGRMIAGVSHEIRNPLGIIRSTAELLGGMPDSNGTQKKLSDMILDASSRLDNIVTEFLDFARPQEPNPQDCYLEELIHKNFDFLSPELEKKRISMHDNLSGRSFRLKADPHLLYRAFLNIFINAIQSMKNGGAIVVDVEEEKDHYSIYIEDTGSGVSEKAFSKIFDPFFSTKDKGSGLGLPIVKNIIEAHNGSVRIESREGSGTKVIIELPKGY